MAIYLRVTKDYQRLSRWLSDVLYVPSQTGSHYVPDQYMGDIASTFVEANSFPEAARSRFKVIQIQRSYSTTR